jgi:hypothetical protein
MANRYRHTQSGVLMVSICAVAAILCASLALLNPTPARWLLWGVAIGSIVVAWLFSSLTVEVNDNELRWHFGPGLWTYRIARGDIDSVRPMRNSWLNGFGIRMRPGFRLYNVSGLDAVELRLKTGDIRRIGTDDPNGLATALAS